MKEIKVKITDWYTVEKFEANKLTGTLNLKGIYDTNERPKLVGGKTYKLVEDEPKYIDTDMIYKTTIKTLLNGVYGGVHLPTKLTPVKFPDSELVKCYCENDVKQIRKLKTSTTYGVFKKARVQFNGNATILEIGDFKTVVKCHKDDKFGMGLGLGLALSRYYEKQPSTKKEIKYLKTRLDYSSLSEYCLRKYFNHDEKYFRKIEKNFIEGKWVDLCLEK